MYEKVEYHCGDLVEVEYHYKGRYGAPGRKREKKERPTPEEVKLQNERNAVKRLRRLVNTNFKAGDIHLILTYQKELRPTPEESKKIIRNFKDKLRRRYRDHNEEFKWIQVTEYEGKAIHHHMIINCPDGYDPSKDIASIWTRGRPKQTRLDGSGNYSQLAEYLVKETARTFREKESPSGSRYTASKNLKKPVVKKKTISANKWRKAVKAPKGFFILPDTFCEGVNPVTGFLYRYYTLQRIPSDRKRKGKEARGG